MLTMRLCCVMTGGAILAVVVAVVWKGYHSLTQGQFNLVQEMIKYRHLINPERYASEVKMIAEAFNKIEQVPLMYFSDNKTVGFLMNMLCSIRQVEMSKNIDILSNIIVITTEKAARERLKMLELKLKTFHLNADEVFQLQNWEDCAVLHVGYPLGWGVRSCVVHGMLNYTEKPVCFGNADTVWTDNFLPVIQESANAKPPFDVIFDPTGYWGPLTGFGEYATFCYRPSKVGKALFRQVHDAITDKAAFDGNVITDICKNNRSTVKCRLFDQKDVAPGSYFLLDAKNKEKFYPKIIHLSPWGYYEKDRLQVKLNRYHSAKIWFLDEREETSNKIIKCDQQKMNQFSKTGRKTIVNLPMESGMLFARFLHGYAQYLICIQQFYEYVMEIVMRLVKIVKLIV